VTKPYVIELEPEVRAWLANLSTQHYRQVEEKADLLARSPTTLGEKTRMREEAEVKRAMLAKELCEAEHGPAHDEFTREFREDL
jgi:hypothetical protein